MQATTGQIVQGIKGSNLAKEFFDSKMSIKWNEYTNVADGIVEDENALIELKSFRYTPVYHLLKTVMLRDAKRDCGHSQYEELFFKGCLQHEFIYLARVDFRKDDLVSILTWKFNKKRPPGLFIEKEPYGYTDHPRVKLRLENVPIEEELSMIPEEVE